MDIRAFFKAASVKEDKKCPEKEPEPVDPALALQHLRQDYHIGFHAPKHKTLPQTLMELPDYTKPYQIFLGNPQGSSLAVSDTEIAATAVLVKDLGVSIYVHSPYIINLCVKNDWNVKLLQTNLKVAGRCGFKGVVVHVGKSTKQPLQEALATMRENILTALESATVVCPLLLETPAGQGTETLTAMDEFLQFVAGIGDERLRICLDTCHVFACGHDPLRYIHSSLDYPGLLKLIHYNDSKDVCGSCKDRHALAGTGHIGLKGMTAIAELCRSQGLPMVIE